MDKRFSIWQLWLPTAVLAAGVVALIFSVSQQIYRTGADDPQVQIANDSVVALDAGRQIVPSGDKLDMNQTLSPILLVLDKDRKIVTSNVSNDPVPLPPDGVFKDVQKTGELRFTWQTANGNRYATVVREDNNGYVVSARSLREVENRTDRLLLICVVALSVIWAITLVLAVILR